MILSFLQHEVAEMVFRHQSMLHVPQFVSPHGYVILGILYVVGQGGIGVVLMSCGRAARTSCLLMLLVFL